MSISKLAEPNIIGRIYYPDLHISSHFNAYLFGFTIAKIREGHKKYSAIHRDFLEAFQIKERDLSYQQFIKKWSYMADSLALIEDEEV